MNRTASAFALALAAPALREDVCVLVVVGIVGDSAS